MVGTFLFLETLVAVISLLEAHVCPFQNATDKPQFTLKLGSEDWVRYGTEIALWCCAEGYDAIKWYRQVDSASGWATYPPASSGDSDAPEVQEDGQILRIYKPKLQDEATYRCDLEKQSIAMQSHSTKLNVVACDPLARGPFAVAPFPHNITIDDYGGNVSIDCTGYFGCHDNYVTVLDVVQWRVAGKYNRDIETLNSRYKVNTTIAEKKTVKKATLTITDVQEVDTEQTFVCQLASPEVDHHQTDIPVKITKQEKPKFPWMLVAFPVGGFIVLTIISVITYKVVSYRWGPRIRLYCNSRLGRGPKTINAEEYKYNLFIYHADEDREIADEMKKHLIENGYEVFITADIPGGQKMARRQFQERPDIIDSLSNIELIERYRFDRDGILFLDANLNNILQPKTNRNHSLSSIQKILVTLRYFATDGIQLNDADIHKISQPSVSRIINEVTNAISDPVFSSRFIKFPLSRDQIQKNNADFYGIARFPNVIGVIDGTHIKIQAPRFEEPAYVNRMGYHSINTQLVFDGQDNIIDLVARWPGATHDSRILRESGLFALFENGHVPGEHKYLLGDSGYPCKRWLMTPYLHPQQGSQTEYNNAHKVTRSKAERAIAQLKRRWSILHGEIRLSPEKACKVITACGVLHNICKQRNIPLLDIMQNNVNVVANRMNYNGPQDGLRYRDFVSQIYF